MKKIFILVFSIFITAQLFSQYKIDTVKFTKETANYTIQVYYPKMYDAENKNYQKDFNLQMEEMAKEKIRYYQDIVKEIPEDNNIPYDLFSVFEVLYYEKDFISILFYDYEFTGGAHGITYLYSYNYDLYQRKIITFDDIFFGDYLKEISKFCIEELTKRDISEEEWIYEGAAPTPENYSIYNFLKDGILISFSEYQVGPYAIGIQQVYIEFANLKKYIK